MLTYTMSEANGTVLVVMKGPVDEKAGKVLNELANRLHGDTLCIDMKGLDYFNSLGMRAWIAFKDKIEKHQTIRYRNCTPDFIYQANMMPVLAENTYIESFFAECYCTSCHHTQMEHFTSEEAVDDTVDIFASRSCASCGKPLVADGDPQAMLAFLKAQKKGE